MKRSVSNTIRASIVVLLAILTGRVEHHNRYHLDSWQQDRFVTVRTLGIPFWRSKEQSGFLRYRDAYTQITGREPDADRWLVNRPDSVTSLVMSKWSCGGFGFEMNERKKLLSALYDRFGEGMPRETAAGLLRRIDAVVPARSGERGNGDWEALDGIRVEVGLEPRLEKVVPETVATGSDKSPTEGQTGSEMLPTH